MCLPRKFWRTQAGAHRGKWILGGIIMARGDKSSYTSKQKRQAQHIEEGYRKRGVSKKEAERRAWATENKISGGGRKSGSGRGQKTNKSSSRKGGRKGGARSHSRSR
jgi:plasmid stabilization system protein ParE